MHLENHIADYKRALVGTRGFRGNNSALLRLQHNPLVQIICFLSGDVLARELHTLSAVSPQMRLDAETLAWTPDHEEECVSATLWFEELYLRLRATAEAPQSQRLAHLVWWAGACRLPVKATVNNARSDVLKLLSDGPKKQVEVLEVQLTSLPTCMKSKAATCDGQCKSILCNLSAFSNLKKLSIQCGQSVNAKKAAVYVTKVLRSVAQLPISEVELNGVTQLGNFAALSGAPHLQSLTAISCGIKSLSELLSCSCLSKLDIKYNPLVESLSVLAGLPSLERLCVQGYHVENLEGLGRCPRLSDLDVSSNERLTSTKGLAGAAQLKKLNLGACDVLSSLEDLSSCPLLEDLDVEFDMALESFQGLAGAPSLRNINANGCALRNVDGLSSCPQLTTINLSENVGLHDLSGLVGAPSLRYINASECGLRNLTGLGRCPALEEVLVSPCELLEDISGLAGAPSLVKVCAAYCRVSNVSGLGSCPRLAELDLHYSRLLVDIRDLARCPSLRILDVSDTGVTNTDFLGPSVKVRL